MQLQDVPASHCGKGKDHQNRSLTGKHCDVVLVGLVQRVVDDTLLIWETLENVHTDLVAGTEIMFMPTSQCMEITSLISGDIFSMTGRRTHFALQQSKATFCIGANH